MEILETKGRKMNKIKREEREDLHTFSDTTIMYVFMRQCSGKVYSNYVLLYIIRCSGEY